MFLINCTRSFVINLHSYQTKHEFNYHPIQNYTNWLNVHTRTALALKYTLALIHSHSYNFAWIEPATRSIWRGPADAFITSHHSGAVGAHDNCGEAYLARTLTHAHDSIRFACKFRSNLPASSQTGTHPHCWHWWKSCQMSWARIELKFITFARMYARLGYLESTLCLCTIEYKSRRAANAQTTLIQAP